LTSCFISLSADGIEIVIFWQATDESVLLSPSDYYTQMLKFWQKQGVLAGKFCPLIPFFIEMVILLSTDYAD
jgi:hypothetical protein